MLGSGYDFIGNKHESGLNFLTPSVSQQSKQVFVTIP